MRLTPPIVLFVTLLGTGPLLQAQQSAAVPPMRVVVDREGLHQITAEDLEPIVDPALVVADRVSLWRDGQEVPIEVRGSHSGRMASGDRILFYASRPSHPPSGSDVYILRCGATGSFPLRVGWAAADPDPLATDEARRILVAEEDQIFEAFPTVRQSVIRGTEPPSYWYWKRLPAPPEGSGERVPDECQATMVLNLIPEPRRSQPATLFVDLVGPVVPGVPQKLGANVNGRELPPATWDTPLLRRVEFRVPAEVLDRSNSIHLRNLAPASHFEEPGNEVGTRRRNVLLIDRLTLDFPTLLAGPAKPGEQLIYRLAREAGESGTPVSFRTLNRAGFVVWNATHHVMGQGRTAKVGPESETVLCCAGPGAIFRPRAVERLRPTKAHLAGSGADYVVITTTRFKAQLEPLIAHRTRQGLQPLVVEARELYDTFTHGRFDPQAIRHFIRAAHQNWKTKPRWLLLVGDADHDVEWRSTKETLPAMLVMTDYNGASATDALFGDVDGDGIPEIAVGRIPARTPEALQGVIDRTIALETNPEPGPWRRTLRFVAGEARFGAAVDALLENTLRSVLTKEIPPGYRVSMTWANPRSSWFWPGRTFSQQVLQQINEGCLVFTYVGHGLRDRFDTVHLGKQRFPIMDGRTASLVDTGRRHPVMAIIACWTGEYDRPDQDCIAEVLLARERGPAAIIASSRISHPYPDALIGKGLTQAFFSGARTLGEVLNAARATMLKDGQGAMALLAKPFLSKEIDPDLLVRDHLYLYNLLGDPALRMPLVTEPVILSVASPARPGNPLQVSGRLASADNGRLLLSLDRPLSRPPSGLQEVDPSNPDAEPRIIENHRLANNPAMVELGLEIDTHDFTATLPLPADLPPGAYHLNAYLARASGQDALGSLPVTVE